MNNGYYIHFKQPGQQTSNLQVDDAELIVANHYLRGIMWAGRGMTSHTDDELLLPTYIRYLGEL